MSIFYAELCLIIWGCYHLLNNLLFMMAMAMILALLLLNFIVMVQPKPSHLSGPDDVYVFKDSVVELTCQVNASSGYAIVWHAIDGNGTGTIVGRCFICPTQEKCSVRTEMADDYVVRTEGDSYILTILKPQIPKTASLGNIQCGYQEVQNCDSDPTPTGRFYLFQSAIVYVYDFPSCSRAVTTLNGSFFQDLTCTWTPRFYGYREEVRVELTFNNTLVQPDVKLPHGIIKRNISSSLQELEEVTKSAVCTVVLSGKLDKSCNFALPVQEDVTVLINPLNPSIRAGKSQEFYCYVEPNATVERSWAISGEGGSYIPITMAIQSLAGDVTFSTNTNMTKESILLKTRTSMTGDSHYFIECSVMTFDGNDVSAFAVIQTLEREFSQLSTSTVETTDPNEVSSPLLTTSAEESSAPSTSIAVTNGVTNVFIAPSTMTPSQEYFLSSTSSRVQHPTSKPTINPTNPSTFPEPSAAVESGSDPESGNMAVFIVIPVIIIFVIIVIVGLAVVWKRKNKRSFKQAAPKNTIEARYELTGPSSVEEVLHAGNQSGEEKEFS